MPAALTPPVYSRRQALEPIVWAAVLVGGVLAMARLAGLPADFLGVVLASIAPAALVGLIAGWRRLWARRRAGVA